LYLLSFVLIPLSLPTVASGLPPGGLRRPQDRQQTLKRCLAGLVLFVITRQGGKG
jgi:hypothetical protein